MYGHPVICPDPLVESGAAVLGGCVVDNDSPAYTCKQCGIKGSKLKLIRKTGKLYLDLDSVVFHDGDGEAKVPDISKDC